MGNRVIDKYGFYYFVFAPLGKTGFKAKHATNKGSQKCFEWVHKALLIQAILRKMAEKYVISKKLARRAVDVFIDWHKD
jgi:hypothetical protein